MNTLYGDIVVCGENVFQVGWRLIKLCEVRLIKLVNSIILFILSGSGPAMFPIFGSTEILSFPASQFALYLSC